MSFLVIHVYRRISNHETTSLKQSLPYLISILKLIPCSRHGILKQVKGFSESKAFVAASPWIVAITCFML